MFNPEVGRKILIDCEIPLTSVSFELVQELERFKPFGIGNSQPTFVSRGVTVEAARILGNDGKHLRLTISHKPYAISAIAFGMGELYPKLSPEKPVDIVYTADIDHWLARRSFNGAGNSNTKLQLKLKDIYL